MKHSSKPSLKHFLRSPRHLLTQKGSFSSSSTYRIRRGEVQKYGMLFFLQHKLSRQLVAGSKSKHIDSIKDIVLGIHLMAERWLNYLIVIYFFDKKKGGKVDAFGETILARLNFNDRIQIVKELNLLPIKDVELLQNLNTIRNAFVHGLRIQNKKFNYKGKKITSWGHIEFF